MAGQWWGWIVLILAAAGFSFAGFRYARKRTSSLEEHLVSRGSSGTLTGACTAAASVIGAWVLFSPAETAVWAGLAGVAGYAVGQAMPLFAIAWLGPRLRRLMPSGRSLTEYVRHRYGRSMQGFTLILMMFYMLVFLAAELTAIAQAVRLLTGIPLFWTACIVAVATVAYTSYGGLRASIATDRMQFFFIVPILLGLLVFAVFATGGPESALQRAREDAPQLFSLRHAPGVEFGLALVIAVLAANLFHQGFWQRVYAARDEQAARRSFFWAGVWVIPMVLAAGVFGLMAIGAGIEMPDGSVAVFHLAAERFPPVFSVLLLVLAIALVMSSMDTLLNGMACAVTCDLASFRPGWRAPALLRSARGVTLLAAIPAVWVASRGLSVLYLFLVADLVCAGAMIPVFYGLFSRRFTGRAAMIASMAGIAAGTLFFPAPDFSPLFPVPWGGRFLVSFAAAALVSGAVAVAGHLWILLRGRSAGFDYSILLNRVGEIGGGPTR